MNIISGSSNLPLAKKISERLGSTLIDVDLSSFSNGERRVWIKDIAAVRGKNVSIVQSFSDPTDQNIMETLIIADALERLGVKEIFLTIPWMGYSLQDKVFRPGEAIAAKVVADLISGSSIDRVILLDLHNTSIPAFFSIPAYHLSAEELFLQELHEHHSLEQAVIVSPDFGGLKRSKRFAQSLDLPLLNIDKSRDIQTGEVFSNALHGGSVEGKDVFVFDDVIVSGGTVCTSAALLKKAGAKKVVFMATHGIFCEQGLDKILDSEADQIIIGNSIQHQDLGKKLLQLDLSSLFANVLGDWS